MVLTDLSERIKAHIRTIPDYPEPGVLFRDITPVLVNAQLMNEIVNSMTGEVAHLKIDAVAAIEARGFILGSLLAYQLGCSFVPVRKGGKLPFETKAQEYTLEYGKASIEMHIDAIMPGANVLIHDDLLATGGTAAAAGNLVRMCGGNIVGFSFLINLAPLRGEEKLIKLFDIRPRYVTSY